MKKRKKKHSKY